MRKMICVIPQDDWYKKSFNVLVPLEIQGKFCEVIVPALPPNRLHGTINAIVEVEGKRYGVPGWAIMNPPQMPTFDWMI